MRTALFTVVVVLVSAAGLVSVDARNTYRSPPPRSHPNPLQFLNGFPCFRVGETVSYPSTRQNVNCVCEVEEQQFFFFTFPVQQWNCTTTQNPTPSSTVSSPTGSSTPTTPISSSPTTLDASG